MYNTDFMLGLKVFVLLIIFTGISYIFEIIMSKYLKVEKPKFFSYNHVNEKHKKIDLIIRITSTIAILVSSFYFTINVENLPWFLQVWFIILIFIVISELVRIYMQWRYVENKKEYIFTLTQLVFNTILWTTVIGTSFFGLI